MIKDITISLPDWIEKEYKSYKKTKSNEDRMSFVINLSKKNIENGGGPFGAAVFEKDSGQLLSVGVNLVMPLSMSIAHAEIVALIFAQKQLNSFNLDDGKKYQLVSSSQPCAQCFGAIVWSGINSLLSGANKNDVESIGFDEGPIVNNWRDELAERGIPVIDNLQRDKALKVLEEYKLKGGNIYNG